MDHQEAIKNRTLERYMLQELTAQECTAFEEHYFACRICAAEVVSTAKFMDNARQPLLTMEPLEQFDQLESAEHLRRHEAEQRRTPKYPDVKEHWWDRWLALTPKPALLGACAALTVALVVQHQAMETQPDVTGSYFLTSTRGDRKTVNASQDQRYLAILFNRTHPDVTNLEFDLHDSADHKVLSFVRQIPGDTPEIQVLLPVAGLRPGSYTLLVRDATSKTGIAELPFDFQFR